MTRLRRVALVCALIAGTALAQSQVVINEFVYDDQGTDNREFVELYNASGREVNITGWKLMAGDRSDYDDNNPDYVIGDTNGDGTPDTTVILAPGAFYVIGTNTGLVPNVNQPVGANDLWENDNEWLALVDTNNQIVDAVAYEVFRGQNFPAEVNAAAGPGIWGELMATEGGQTDATYQSWSRYRDGADSNNSARDFVLVPATPGAPNNVPAPPSSRISENFDNLAVGAAVPDWTGSFRNPRVIDPTQVGNPAINPNAIPASPQGGNAMIAWDWAGGGNQAALNYVYDRAAGYTMLVYIDPTRRSRTDEDEAWAIGVLGTSDTFFRTPFRTNACGITGVAWVFYRSSSVSRLQLVDAGDGGDSTDSPAPRRWQVLQTIDLSSYSPGWYRLSLVVRNGVIRAKFDNISVCGTTEPRVGQVYIGYREFIYDNSTTRPPTIDDLTIFVPIEGDVNYDGVVNNADLLEILFNFGSTACSDADLNGDGTVNNADLLTVLFNFGRS
ncbi:MAG: lamin tail domain-containing protein [Fimbriimonadales bacterium]|nr:lamin tail domain-containing protein [Fimbriimonadales bacterium]MDW8051049.1 lamin tail domain-containing protein [Armatimonadota bacterium]